MLSYCILDQFQFHCISFRIRMFNIYCFLGHYFLDLDFLSSVMCSILYAWKCANCEEKCKLCKYKKSFVLAVSISIFTSVKSVTVRKLIIRLLCAFWNPEFAENQIRLSKDNLQYSWATLLLCISICSRKHLGGQRLREFSKLNQWLSM